MAAITIKVPNMADQFFMVSELYLQTVLSSPTRLSIGPIFSTCEYSNEDEDNSPDNVNNHNTSSQTTFLSMCTVNCFRDSLPL